MFTCAFALPRHVHHAGADGLPSSRFRGRLSRLRVFDAALSPAHVNALHQQDLAAMTPAGRAVMHVQSRARAAPRGAAQAAPASLRPTPASSSSPATASWSWEAESLSGGGAPDASPAVAFPLLNGEVSAGVISESGRWADAVGARHTSAGAAASPQRVAVVACNASEGSALPLPMDVPQLLPLSGFTVSAWVRLPLAALAPSAQATAVLPILSAVSTQQAAVAAPATVGSAPNAAAAGGIARRLQAQGRRLAQDGASSTGAAPSLQQQAPVTVPLGAHAYYAPGSQQLHVALMVAVVPDAVSRLAQGLPFDPVVQVRGRDEASRALCCLCRAVLRPSE